MKVIFKEQQTYFDIVDNSKFRPTLHSTKTCFTLQLFFISAHS